MESLKTIIVIIVSFSVVNISAQNISGHVYYKLKVDKNIIDPTTMSKKDEKYGGMLSVINNSISKHEDNLEFRLTFNKNESIFEILESLENDFDKSYQIALALSGALNVYYNNHITKEKLTQKNAYGQMYIVNEAGNNNWNLENISKEISGYKCYKASFKKVVKNSRGTFNKIIEAWYAPEIPVNFGPKGYLGLPGLILELNEGKLKYYSVKMELNQSKELKIKKPSKGKVISQEELDSIGRSLYDLKKRSLEYR